MECGRDAGRGLNQNKLESLRAILPDVSRETFERLIRFERLFLEWNSRINLASASSAGRLWDRHILDSAQLAAIAPMRGTWLDVGSGGGFPGIVLAEMMVTPGAEGTGGHVHLVESIGKKAAFLNAALHQAGGGGTVHAMRIESAVSLGLKPDYVTARALAPLPELLKLTFPWLKSGAKGLFHKGRRHREEIAAAHGGWRFDLIEHQSRTDADSVILEISNVSRRL
jgi:16S rRNA (guanine527-N7)-methyltransferase